MAEETQDDIDVSEDNGRKKWLLIGGILIVLVIAGTAAALLLGGGDSDEKDTQAQAEQRAEPIYHSIESPLVVNFSRQSDDEVRYLQVEVEVMARDTTVIQAFKRHQPAIIHQLLMLFYSQNYDDLTSREGTRALKTAAAETINDFLSQEEKLDNGIERVLFSSFVMQ